MAACPNVNLPEWKELVEKIGEDRSYARWNYADSTLGDLELRRDKPIRGELGRLVDKVKLYIEKKIAILEKKKVFNKSEKERELKELKENLKALGEADTLNEFIEDAYAKTVQAEELFEKLKNKADTMDRSEVIQKLQSFNDFVNGYSILDEISAADLEEILGSKKFGIQESGDFSTKSKLDYAIRKKQTLKESYLKVGLPLLADFLLESKSAKLDVETQKRIQEWEGKLKAAENSTLLTPAAKERRIKEAEDMLRKIRPYDLTKEKLVQQLKVANADISIIDFWFSPLISSEDSVLALFAKSIKNSLEDARLKDIKSRDEISDEYEQFRSSNTKSRDNLEKFNSDIIEVNEIPITGELNEDGTQKYKKEKAFVQKFDQNKWKKAKEDLFKKIGKKPEMAGLAQKKWIQELDAWYQENTQPKSKAERDKIIQSKKDDLLSGVTTKEEYDEWYESVIHEHAGIISYRRELAEPVDKYINEKWSNLYTEDGKPKNAAGRYHKFMLDRYLKQQEKLPDHYKMGNRLPSIPKGNLERVQTQGALSAIKTRAKEAVQFQSYDNAAGITDLSGEDAMLIPVYYTEQMSADDVSSDVFESILKFEQMTNRFEALNNIQGEITLMKQVVGQREVVSTTGKGSQIIDAFAKKHGYSDYIKKNGESYSQLHINAFIDMVVSGEMMKKEEILGLSAGKVVNTLTGISAVTTLAFDFLKATANNIQGNIQVMIEANSGEHFTKTNVRKAAAFYLKNTGEMLNDFGRPAPKALASKLVDLYDAIQGEFVTQYGENVSGSMARKLLRSDTLFFNQKIAEHEIQVKALFAMLDANMVNDNKSGEMISVLEAYEKYGIDISDHTDFTEKQRKDIMNTHHAVAKRLHGVYNSFDRGTAQRYALGRALTLYRKYLIPSYKRRWKSISADQEAGVFTEGFYRTFNRTFIRDMRELQFNISKNWENYTDFERAQIKKVIAEASFILAAFVLMLVLKNAGDDDDDLRKGKGFTGWAYNMVLYQAVRQRAETFAYLNPWDAMRTLKSPTALNTTIERAMRLADQVFLEWDPEKLAYKKKTGVFEKGTNKSWAYTLKLLGMSGYNAYPEEAVKAFQSISQ